MADRPLDFRLNYGHPLAQNLVFAGFGRLPMSTHYNDASLYGSHGTLVGSTPSSDWVWSNSLGRIVYSRVGNHTYCQLPNAITVTTNWSIACWGVPVSSTGLFGNLNSTGSYTRFVGDGATDVVLVNDANSQIKKWYGVISLGVLYHFAAVADGANATLYINGISKGSGSLSGTFNFYRLGTNGVTSWTGMATSFVDATIHRRALSNSEISALADPSNVMLSGLILPPRRRLFGAVAAATGWKPYFARPQSRVYSGGVS